LIYIPFIEQISRRNQFKMAVRQFVRKTKVLWTQILVVPIQ